MPAIAPRDVSVVVQGPWHDEHTPRCLAGIAEALPGAEVVLSVWRAGPAFPAFDVRADVVLLNDDPGAVDIAGVLSPEVERRTAITNTNLNRQLVSTRNGLALARRPYALKLRTDMTVEHAGFLAHAERFRGVPGPLRVFRERIVTTNARSPRRSFCMFVQDFCSFGLTEDMRLLWDAPPVPPRAALLALPQAERDARVLVPEQHILLGALRRRHDLPMRDALDTSPELETSSERAIAGNFVCLDARRFGVRALKPSLAWVNEPGEQRYAWLWILKASYAEFLSWCREHCDHDFAPFVAECGAGYEAELADVAVKRSLIIDDKALNGGALLTLGERTHRAGRLDEARNAYVTLMRAGYAHPLLFHGLGVLLIQSGDPAAGTASLRRSAAMAPGFAPPCEALAQHARMTGDAAAAAHWQAEAERRRAGG